MLEALVELLTLEPGAYPVTSRHLRLLDHGQWLSSVKLEIDRKSINNSFYRINKLRFEDVK